MARIIGNWIGGDPALEDELRLMRNKEEALSARAADIRTEVENAELHPGKKRKREVDNWLKNVNELKIRVEEVASLKRKDQILKITDEMEELLEQAKFNNGLTVHDLASSSIPLVTTEMKGQQFKENLGLILSWLMTDEVSRIGVYGVGGVGKTTLVMHIHNQLLNDLGKYGNVFWVTVSQECTISMLQHKIARALDLPHLLEEADEMKRPAILSEALKKRSKVVLILDDMWEYLPMEKVGLPPGQKQCKLILSTRSLDVCRRMACQQSVKAEPLSDEESWSLFTERLGSYDDLPREAKDIAKLVAKKCAGLPLGIVVVAASMRGVVDVYEWSNALEELTKSTRIHGGMESEVFPSLQLSYSRLNNVKLQDCFLSFASYPEDYLVEKERLVNHWIMEGHLEEIQSRQAQEDMARTILDRLINACLLDAEGVKGKYVKMHDLIRDMAISIARQRHHLMIKAGMQLREVPCLREWTEELTKVSLVHNEIGEISPAMSPRCPKLSILLLNHNPLRAIPDSFFSCLDGLKFLDLSGTLIERVPDRISDLGNLSALNLCGCSRLFYVPPVGNLTKLRYLDLSWCQHIKVLPQGMEKLVNLEYLSLASSKKLCVPFSELTSRLSNIRCLELTDGVKDIKIRDIQKLGHLEKLTGCHIHQMSNFNRYVKCQHLRQLTSYEIILGFEVSGNMIIDDIYNMKIKMIRRMLDGRAGEEQVVLPHCIQELQLWGCDSDKGSLIDALPSLRGLTRLRKIFICECEGIESLWSVSSCIDTSLESLEELELGNLQSFRALAIGRAQLPSGALSSLKRLEVTCCTVEKLFTPCLLKGQLRNLECMNITHCSRLEEIFAESNLDDDDSEQNVKQDSTVMVELPKLRLLYLQSLPKLARICGSGLLCCRSIDQIAVLRCPGLKKLPLFLPLLGGMPSAPPSLREIIIDRNWWSSLEWDHSHIKHALDPFVKFTRWPN